MNRDRGGGQVVSVFAFSDDPSSNPFEAYNFFCNNVFEKIENKQKGGRGWATFFKKNDESPSGSWRALSIERVVV